MSDDEKDQLARESQAVQDAVEKFGGRNLIAIVIATFGAAVWATTMKIDSNQIKLEIQLIKSQQDQQVASTELRIAEWTAWRRGIDSTIDARMKDRFTSRNWDVAVGLSAMQTPPILLPSFQRVQQNTPTP